LDFDFLPPFLLVFMRVSGLMFTSPVFNLRSIPGLTKIGFSFLVAWSMYPQIPVQLLGSFPSWPYFFQAISQVAIGLLLGYILNLSVQAVYLAGQLMDMPMGFGMVNILDPQMGVQVPMMAQFYHLLAILVFLGVDGHHLLLAGLIRSFRFIPVGPVAWGGPLLPAFLEAFAWMFLVGVKIALPIVGAIFLTDFVLGIIARSVPQINVFIIGFPIKIAVGFFVLLFAIPVYIRFMAGIYGEGGEMIGRLWQVIAAFGAS
jgi:flagellar biosynthetic protein FliR